MLLTLSEATDKSGCEPLHAFSRAVAPGEDADADREDSCDSNSRLLPQKVAWRRRERFRLGGLARLLNEEIDRDGSSCRIGEVRRKR